MLLVGDWAQLAAVDAGGAFALLARARDDTPELTQVHRFHQPWEADASLQLRAGDPAVIDTYAAATTGSAPATSDDMLDAAYTAWQTDLAAGRASLMIAPTRDTVIALNTRARNDRIAAGDVAAGGAVALHDGTAGLRRRRRRHAPQRPPPPRRPPLGPQRRPLDRHRHPPRRHRHRPARRRQRPTCPPPTSPSTSSSATPPRSIASQGADRRHRPRHRATRHDPRSPLRRHDPRPRRQHRLRHHRRRHHRPRGPHRRSSPASAPSRPPTTRSATSRSATPPSPSSPPSTRPSPARAQHDRWIALLRRSGLTPEQTTAAIATSDAFGRLTAALRRAEAHHHDLDALLPRIVATLPTDANDVAAALHDRLRRATTPRTGSSRPRPAPQLIAGLIPEATGPMPDDMRDALAERQHLIEQRARTLADTAIAEHAPWIRALGPPPRDPRHRDAWHRHVQTIAAYRDRYGITDDLPLGPAPATAAQRADAARAHAALIQAQRLAARLVPGNSCQHAPPGTAAFPAEHMTVDLHALDRGTAGWTLPRAGLPWARRRGRAARCGSRSAGLVAPSNAPPKTHGTPPRSRPEAAVGGAGRSQSLLDFDEPLQGPAASHALDTNALEVAQLVGTARREGTALRTFADWASSSAE